MKYICYNRNSGFQLEEPWFPKTGITVSSGWNTGVIPAGLFNRARRELSNWLMSEKYSGEHWLLLYEVVQKDLLKDCGFISPEENEFFKELRKNKVNFYESSGK